MSVLPLRALAPAKVNLGLFVGPVRGDGRHELATVMQSISLADELVVSSADSDLGADEVVCPGVSGVNLAAEALAAFRQRFGWDVPPLRLEIDKRVPVAAGLGGGSADAAAALRLAAAAAGVGEESELLELATELGADVPAQVRPGRWLAAGAGEQLRELPPPREPLALVVLPVSAALSTGDVYAEADRLGILRDAAGLADVHRALERAFSDGAALPGAAELLTNDLEAAALSLCPQIGATLAPARSRGADALLVSGSGPTVVAAFAGADAGHRAQAAVAQLGAREGGAVLATAVGPGFGDPVVAGVRHNSR